MPRPPPTSRYFRPAPARARSTYTRTASFTAPLIWRILVIWLPRWKCSRLRQSAIPSSFSSCSARMADLAAQVEVQQVEAVGHPQFFQLLQRAHGLGHGEAELRTE